MSWTDDFSFLLSPVEEEIEPRGYSSREYGKLMKIHRKGQFPDLSDAKLVFLGVCENRRSDGESGVQAPSAIRQQFYALHAHQEVSGLVDLGNINPGNTPSDSDVALRTVIEALLSQNIGVIILGGDQASTFAIYEAYEKLESTVNVACIDSSIDMGEFRDPLSNSNFLSKIVIRDPAYLFNMSLIGFQSYFVDQETLEMVDKLYFDACRLGEAVQDLKKVEPYLRSADLVSIDMQAVRNEAAPGTGQPNGFTGEHICQLARYCGLSEKTSTIGIFNYNPHRDTNNQQALLIAEMLWYMVDGFFSRIREFPLMRKKEFIQYKVSIRDQEEDLIFFKSRRTNKWWMNIAYHTPGKVVPRRTYLVPCSYADYEMASRGEIPDLWWKTYQKLI
jgi:arginase family enzyme